MTPVSIVRVVTAALVLGYAAVATAQTARLRHVVSIYADANGAGLNLPEAVACGGNGQIVIGDTGNNRLLRFTYRDKAVSGGTEVKIPQIASPVRLQLNSKGEIYALDSTQRKVVRLSAEGEFKDTLAFEGAPAPASVVPKSFAIDSADNLYVLDVFSARVLVLNPQGQFQRAVTLPADAGFGSEVAVDFAGTIIVLDSLKRRMFSAEKTATSFAPLGGDLAEYVATLPTYMTTSKGMIFVVEGNGGSILGFGRDGSFLGRQLKMGWNEGLLNHPSQMCINDNDDVFIADRDNSRVQVFQLVR